MKWWFCDGGENYTVLYTKICYSFCLVLTLSIPCSTYTKCMHFWVVLLIMCVKHLKLYGVYDGGRRELKEKKRTHVERVERENQKLWAENTNVYWARVNVQSVYLFFSSSHDLFIATLLLTNAQSSLIHILFIRAVFACLCVFVLYMELQWLLSQK